MKDGLGSAELLNNLKTKYRCLNQFYDLTREMEKSLQDGDGQAAEMYVEMRQKQLDVCMEMDRKNRELVEQLNSAEAQRISGMVFTRTEDTVPEDAEEEELLSMKKRIRVLLDKIIDYDNGVRSGIMKEIRRE